MKYLAIVFFVVLSWSLLGQSGAGVSDDGALIFSSIGDAESRPVSLELVLPDSVNSVNKVLFSLTGSEYFSLKSELPVHADEAGMVEIEFIFKGNSEIGVKTATANLIDAAGNVIQHLSLRGLCSPALEGENEPPLSDVLKTLGYKIDLGWTSLANHVKPELQGEELGHSLFRAAGNGAVVIEPIARYSPDFILPFGYYPAGNDKPELNEVGVLAAAGAYPEHQMLYPDLASGSTTFDPGDLTFGLYTTSPSHTAYTEDKLNEKHHPDHAAHAVRVYPLRDEEGAFVENAYLICFEEAKNGDYQDYVFVLRNVVSM